MGCRNVDAFFVFGETGVVGGLTFQRSMAARPASLGEAFSGVVGELDGMTINPASPAKLDAPSISSTYLRGFDDDNFGTLDYGQPFSFGGIFIGGSYYDAGKIDINQSSGLQVSRTAQQDLVARLGFAIGRQGPLSVGVTGKYLRSTLAEEATATGFAADAGVQWQSPFPGLAFGGSALNLGGDLKFEHQGDPLPRTVRGGVAYMMDLEKTHVLHDFPYTFLFLADGIKVRDDKAGVRAGLEMARKLTLFESNGNAALRFGYRSDSDNFNMGVGFLIANVSFDYALQLTTDVGPSHRFTLGYRFSPKTDKPKPRR